MDKKIYLTALLLTASFFFQSNLQAKETAYPKETEDAFSYSLKREKNAPPTYLEKLDQKFDKGSVNFLTGWTEILSEPYEHCKAAKESTRLKRWTAGWVGLGEGLVNGSADTIFGFLNAFTSPLPQWSLPLPEDGVDIQTVTGAKADIADFSRL